MTTTGTIDVERANSLLDVVLSTFDEIGDFCRIGGNDLLQVAQKLERVHRRSYDLQVRIADEINAQGLASQRSCTSTAVLLRQTLNISPGDANARVRAAVKLHPQDLPTGAETPVILPLLAEAVRLGTVNNEHVRVILTFHKRLPGKLPESKRVWCETFLVEHAQNNDPKDLQAIADTLENAINPDGTLHNTEPSKRMELTIGQRNAATGLTSFRGRLDDLGIETLRRAIDPFSSPRSGKFSGNKKDRSTEEENGPEIASVPDGSGASHESDPDAPGASLESDPDAPGASHAADADADANANANADADADADADSVEDPTGPADGMLDLRSASARRAHALVETLGAALDNALLPTQGGERPHLTVVLDWDLVNDCIGAAKLATGPYLTPAAARQMLCDAAITPAILGTDSEVLDVGRTKRTFPPSIRRALALRDGGCAWPGCDRPPHWTDAHHIRQWCRDRGETSLHNGVLLCKRHHTEVHKNEWEILMGADGRPDFIPPAWIDPDRKPRRNTLHHTAPRRW